MNSTLPLMAAMRFTGYVGVSINAIAVPLIVWKSTGNPFLAGLSLLIEWVPKLFAYLHAGYLASKTGGPWAHRTAEIARILSMGLLAYAAFQESWIIAAVAASICQFSNAISNVCFESMAHKIGIKAHARLMQADLAAGLVVVPLTLLFPLEWIPIAGLCAHAGALLLSFVAEKQGVYSEITNNQHIGVFRGIKRIVSDRKLLTMTLAGFLMSTPIAAVFSFLPAIMEKAESGWGEAQALSIFAAARAIIGIILMKPLSSVKKTSRLPFYGSLGAATSFAAVVLFGNGVSTPVALVLAGIFSSAFSIWTRQTRQELLSGEERLSMTGILISVEASSYLAGAFIISLLPKDSADTSIFNYGIPLFILACIFSFMTNLQLRKPEC